MKPLNLDNKPCSPISSNCVIWQGPDIECITLCKGDTVSDVVHALAVELCTLMKQTNVSSYDLTCLGISAACPPENFEALIQLLISKICELENIPPSTPTTGSGCPDCVVSVADCFVEGTTTNMQLVDYVQAIANKVCSLITEILSLQDQINNIDIRVTALENATPPSFTIPPIPTGCFETIIGSPTAAIDVVLDNLVNDATIGYCATIDVLLGSSGTAADLLAVLNPSCITAASASIVDGNDAGVGTMSSAYPGPTGWILAPNTLAETIQNLWIAVCDLRNITTVAFTDSDTISFTQNTGLPNYNFTANINQPRALIRNTGSDTLGGGASNINAASGLYFIRDGYVGSGGTKDLCSTPFKFPGVAGSSIYDTFSPGITAGGNFVVPAGMAGVYNIGYNIVLTAPNTSALPVAPNPAVAGTFFGTGKGWYGGDNLSSNDTPAGVSINFAGTPGVSTYVDGLVQVGFPSGTMFIQITVGSGGTAGLIVSAEMISYTGNFDLDDLTTPATVTQGVNSAAKVVVSALTKPNPRITVVSAVENVAAPGSCELYASDSFAPNNSVSKCTLSGTALGVVLKDGDTLEVKLGIFVNDEDPLTPSQPNPRWDYLTSYLAASDYFEFFIQKIGD